MLRSRFQEILRSPYFSIFLIVISCIMVVQVKRCNSNLEFLRSSLEDCRHRHNMIAEFNKKLTDEHEDLFQRVDDLDKKGKSIGKDLEDCSFSKKGYEVNYLTCKKELNSLRDKLDHLVVQNERLELQLESLKSPLGSRGEGFDVAQSRREELNDRRLPFKEAAEKRITDKSSNNRKFFDMSRRKNREYADNQDGIAGDQEIIRMLGVAAVKEDELQAANVIDLQAADDAEQVAAEDSRAEELQLNDIDAARAKLEPIQ